MKLSRREFVARAAAGAGGLLLAPWAEAESPGAFSFVLLGDLHFDRLEHHDLAWLERDKPDDLRQARNYSALTRDIMPRLFSTVRETIAELNRSPETRVAFVAQVGDLVEGLCGSEALAVRQNNEAVDFLADARLDAPFLFSKGNHDITGPGAPEAFRAVFHPFLSEQARRVNPDCKLSGARFAIERGGALFCFFDAYDKESLPWLEAELAKRTAAVCFVVVHPPVVPYGARSTWHLFSGAREKAQRDRLLELLGRRNAFVLSGHIHKYSLLARNTAGGGRFVQFALSSVIPAPEVTPQNELSGVGSYTADQVKVEPDFSRATEAERRAVYETEAPFVKAFEYADLPGYAVVTVNGSRVSVSMHAGIGRKRWRSADLSSLLAS